MTQCSVLLLLLAWRCWDMNMRECGGCGDVRSVMTKVLQETRPVPVTGESEIWLKISSRLTNTGTSSAWWGDGGLLHTHHSNKSCWVCARPGQARHWFLLTGATVPDVLIGWPSMTLLIITTWHEPLSLTSPASFLTTRTCQARGRVFLNFAGAHGHVLGTVAWWRWLMISQNYWRALLISNTRIHLVVVRNWSQLLFLCKYLAGDLNAVSLQSVTANWDQISKFCYYNHKHQIPSIFDLVSKSRLNKYCILPNCTF